MDQVETSPYIISGEKNSSGEHTYYNIGLFIAIVVLLILLYVYYTSSEGFAGFTILSDAVHDKDGLEDQIERLNQMQKRNLNNL